MKLPDRFQFRTKKDTGFTHTATVSGNVVSVKWARGWHEKRFAEEPYEEGDSIWTQTTVQHATCWIEEGGWLVVDEAPQEQSLPDVFYIETSAGKYKFTKEGSTQWRCSTTRSTLTAVWNGDKIAKHIARGDWKLLEESVLTAEQQRVKKEAREQIQQLENSVRIQEQTVEHHQRMIGNYRERIETLKTKIVEE